MAIFIKATIKCDGWNGRDCVARSEPYRTDPNSPTCVPATAEATLSVSEDSIADVNAEFSVLQVSWKPDWWDVRSDGRVKCPTCIKDEAAYRQAKYQREKTEVETKKEAAIKRGLAKMRGRV
jgi:hypothetical protein